MHLTRLKTRNLYGILNKFWAKVSRTSEKSADPAKGPAGEIDATRSPLAVSPGTHASLHDDGLALLHIPSGRVFLCNRTAARIWQGASKGLSLDELSEEMSRKYCIGLDVAREDTHSLVSQMELHGLVLRSDV
jgi:hypothetical protein